MKFRVLLVLLSASATVVSCVVQSTPMPGPKGEKGDPGSKGADGTPDDETVAAMQAQIDELQAKLDKLSAETNSNCPRGYAEAPETLPAFLPGATACVRGADEVVRVGTGATAFWIDRYEASVWTTPDGPADGFQVFETQDDSDPILFPKSGQFVVPYYALSVSAVAPARRISWFQALEACAASGKRLPSRQEWLRAARGTVDPLSGNDGTTNQRCNSSAATPRLTGNAVSSGQTLSCVSDWGVEDMIANLWEWTDEWHAGLYDEQPPGTTWIHNWPDSATGSFHQDSVGNISSWVACGEATLTQGVPSATARGGSFKGAHFAGVFSMDVRVCPANAGVELGFRCVVPQ